MEGSESYKPDADTYNAFISSYANMGNKAAAEAWLKAKVSSKFPADSQTYGFLVCCCIKSRAFDDARRYFEEMMLNGLLPDESVVKDVLLMYCQLGNSGKVKEVLKFGLNCGWEIDQNVMKKVVVLYRELGLVEDLEELVKTLKESSQSSQVCSLAHCALIRMYSDKDRLDDGEC